MGLDIYYFPASQPSRSVVMFLKLNKIEYNDKLVNFITGEQNTPEYLAMNPNHAVPVMDDDGFVICQSVAIVKYLASKYQTADHWYPSDLKKRAKVDELLDWQHTNIRKHGIGVFFYIKLGHFFGLPALTPEQIDERYKELDGSMTLIECFLKDQKYLCGDEITLADLFIANEVLQPTKCERDIYEKHPKVKAWIDRVRERLNPVWDEMDGVFDQILSGLASR
ncbi:glutathione S-transferase theta-3-like [Amphiura filiformis]|uniref:glutathione S-transferase theta-3-like n=1 Tax=Amphiura filiformis TaxID=82378 RepID=UPI003B224530